MDYLSGYRKCIYEKQSSTSNKAVLFKKTTTNPILISTKANSNNNKIQYTAISVRLHVQDASNKKERIVLKVENNSQKQKEINLDDDKTMECQFPSCYIFKPHKAIICINQYHKN
jgi:hypothetical protein